MGVKDFFSNLILKVLSEVPESKVDYDSHVSSLKEFLGYVNYFIPFYDFRNLFLAWVGIMTVATTVFGIYAFLKKKGLIG